MKRIVTYLKREMVLCAAAFLALLSMFFVKPDRGYVDYLDGNFVPDKKPDVQPATYQQQHSSYLDAIRNRVKMVDEWYASESNEPTMWDLIDEKEE